MTSSSSLKKMDSVFPEPAVMYFSRSISELDTAAVMIQKFYRSHLTRRYLEDCTVVVEELWWKALDFEARKRRSVALRHSVRRHLTSEKPTNSDHSKDGVDSNNLVI